MADTPSVRASPTAPRVELAAALSPQQNAELLLTQAEAEVARLNDALTSMRAELELERRRRVLAEGQIRMDRLGGDDVAHQGAGHGIVEHALRVEHDQFAQLLQGLSDLGEALIAGEGQKLSFVNDAFCQLTGYTREELLALPTLTTLMAPELQEASKERMRRIQSGEDIGVFEGGLRHKNGYTVPLEIATHIVPSGERPRFVSVMRDISERRRTAARLRSSEELFRRSVETLMDGFALCHAVHDSTGRVIDFQYGYINAAGCRLNGLSRDEHVGRTLVELHPALAADGVVEAFIQVMDTGGPLARETLLYAEIEGAQRLVQALDIRAVRLDEGLALVWRDITERKLSEEVLIHSELRLQASLAEKEVLLKEVHHRVKNNLQVITSLLRLQAKQLVDPQAREQFRDTQHRVYAMALVHEQLYGTADLAHINIAAYVQSLATSVLRSYTAQTGTVGLVLSIPADLVTTIDMAVPLGLILTELISNSVKYAFPDGRRGMVSVDARVDSTSLSLQIADDGVGLPDELDVARHPSLGLQLVRRLVAQLRGTLNTTLSEGTAFVLTVPHVANGHLAKQHRE